MTYQEIFIWIFWFVIGFSAGIIILKAIVKKCGYWLACSYALGCKAGMQAAIDQFTKQNVHLDLLIHNDTLMIEVHAEPGNKKRGIKIG